MSQKKKKINITDIKESKPEKKLVNKVEAVSLPREKQKKKHPFINFILILTLLTSLGYFIITLMNGQTSVHFLATLISGVLLVLFSVFFVASAITNPKEKKGTILLSGLLLTLFNSLGILTNLGIVTIPAVGMVEEFSGKSLTEVVQWASKNNITLIQDYEYSDMIPEYSIINQSAKAGTKIKEIKEFTVAVSEGASPNKEVIIPNMVGWDAERVLTFVKDNFLSNVQVEFVESDKAKDTVIEQSKSGNLKRSDEIKLTFSLGEEKDKSDVTLIDLVNKSEFEAVFYLKQHSINYELKHDFSKKIKRGNVASQNKKAGSKVPVDSDDKLEVTISKGPKIKVPDLKKMSMTEITKWIIQNKLKLEFTDRYDDSVKDNEVIEVNHKKGDIVEQGDLIKLVISKGKLTMQEFASFDEFREWADKYGIKYEEKHEFNDDIETGKVISYSYKKGDIIKNNDVIIVTISDGKKCEVPNLVGMSKNDIIAKLKKLDLNYNFVYQASSKVAKDKAIKQSVAAGSEVSKGTTITVTLSNGKSASTSGNSSSSNNNNSSGNNSGNNGGTTPSPTPSCDKNKTVHVYLSTGATGAQTKSMIQNSYPNIKWNFQMVSSCSNGSSASGTICNSSSIDDKNLNYCDSYTVIIVS